MSIYSLKMRASKHTGSIQEHVSGAEKILPQQELPQQMEALLSRALHHAKGKADFINLKIEVNNYDSHRQTSPQHMISSISSGYIP